MTPGDFIKAGKGNQNTVDVCDEGCNNPLSIYPVVSTSVVKYRNTLTR